MTSRKTQLCLIAAALFLMGALTAGASDPARTPESGAQGEQPDLSHNPITYQNEGGDFQIIFPSGCGKIVTRYNEPDLYGGEDWDDIVQVTFAFCDRFQKTGEGCSVSATFNMHGKDGSMAGAQHVVARVQNALKEYGAQVVDQKALKREFDNGIQVEGVEVRAQSPEGPGEVWVRGLLVDGDIYILVAWNNKGGLWDNPDYLTFFNSFQPWTE